MNHYGKSMMVTRITFFTENLSSAVIKSPKFYALGTPVPARLLQADIAIWVSGTTLEYYLRTQIRSDSFMSESFMHSEHFSLMCSCGCVEYANCNVMTKQMCQHQVLIELPLQVSKSGKQQCNLSESTLEPRNKRES